MSFIKNYAKGRRPIGVMNKLEERFSLYLEDKKQLGEIVWWAYESIRLALAPRCTYTPDFLVMTKDLELQVFEVKGVWLPAARNKVRISADKFPFHFFGAMWDSKQKEWKIEEF